MPDRTKPVRAASRDRTTNVVTRSSGGDGGGTDPTPGPFPETPPATDTNTSTVNRLAGASAVRELTVHPAQGVVPQQFGGPLRVGGYPIYYRKVGLYHFLDLAIGEGPYEDISQVLFGTGITAGHVGCAVEFHLGTPGDTGSTLINFVEGAYLRPEGIASVVLRFKDPTQANGTWSPFDFTCQATRGTYTDPDTGYTGSSSNPIVAAYMIMASRVDAASQLIGPDWEFARDYCATEVDTGIPRWDFALRVDQEDTVENWVKTVLAYCKAYLRYNDGQHSVYMESLRDFALDGDGNVIHFLDYEALLDSPVIHHANTTGPVTYTRKGAAEIPTFVTIDYTEVSTVLGVLTFQASSVQIPSEIDLDPTLDRVELRLSLLGIQSIERARRRATLEFNIAQRDQDIVIPSRQGATQLLPGDRVRVGSKRLCVPGFVNPNAFAQADWEDVVLTDLKLGDSPVMRARIYRESDYGDAIDVTGPPEPPPPPPDQEVDPECPTDLYALSSDPSEYGLIQFSPADPDDIISGYDVHDIYSGDFVVGTIDKSTPLGYDGLYHASFPALVHTDLDGGKHLHVRVVSFSYAGNFGSSCSDTSWDIEPGDAGTCCFHESSSWLLNTPTIASTSYVWSNYGRTDTLSVVHNTVQFDATGDFFPINTGEGTGILVPKREGQYFASATIGWEGHADANYRALSFFYLRRDYPLHGGNITIGSGGSGYLSGEALTFTGGTLATGGIPWAGTIIASGGVIIGFAITDWGIGYTVVPTVGVTTAGGTGATLTAHLPAAFVLTDINPVCDNAGLPILGKVIAEDILPAVNDSGVPTRQTLSVMLPMKRGSGLLIGYQQGSGVSLDLLDSTDTAANVAALGGCRLSLQRISDATFTETLTLCPEGG